MPRFPQLAPAGPVIDLRDPGPDAPALSTRLEDLVPGLVLFFARPSPLQTWAELFGHEWRHVGVIVRTDEGLRVASYGPKKCFRLDDPFEIMGAYSRVGVARVFASDVELSLVEDFCRSFRHLERSDSPYIFSGVFVGPIHRMARERSHGRYRSLLFALVNLYCMFQRLRFRDRTAYVCSTFIWEAVHASRSQPLRTPLSAHPDDDAAYATPTNDSDELYARWLCGPTELWEAISEPNRVELDLSDIAVERPSPQGDVPDDASFVVPPTEIAALMV